MYQSYSSMMFNITEACCSMDGPNWKNMEWSSWETKHGASQQTRSWVTQNERGAQMTTVCPATASLGNKCCSCTKEYAIMWSLIHVCCFNQQHHMFAYIDAAACCSNKSPRFDVDPHNNSFWFSQTFTPVQFKKYISTSYKYSKPYKVTHSVSRSCAKERVQQVRRPPGPVIFNVRVPNV